MSRWLAPRGVSFPFPLALESLVFSEVTFPEAVFPASESKASEYRQRVFAGLARMRQSSVVVCGLARNVAEVLPVTLARVERLGELFADYRVILFENDSRDGTAAVLTEWSRRNPRGRVLSETLGDCVNPTARCLRRAERMARYRNRYLDVVKSEFADFTHAIVLDTDLKGGWSLDGLADTFGHDAWDFVGSNGIIFKRLKRDWNVPVQYDAWAFRLDDKMTPLPVHAVNAMQWQRGQPLVPVTSCFGGLGVYRMPALLAAGYDGWDSEHVPLHQQMRQNGDDRLFLNPSQITVYGRRQRTWDRLWFPSLNWLRRPHRPTPSRLLAQSLTEQPVCLDMLS